MTGFQSSVRFDYAFGVPGEKKYDGPSRVNTGFLGSVSAAYNIVGATIFTQPVAGGEYSAGGLIGPGSGNTFVGMLCNPKLYASFGTSSGGPLAPTLTIPNNVEAEFAMMGEYIVSVPAACNIGDLLTYNTTTGAIATIPQQASFTGVIAVTTGILTASALTAGSTIDVGTYLTGTGVPLGTQITSQLSGTPGAAGTYQTNIVTAVASTAMTTPNIPASGSALVPNAVIEKFAQPAAAGLALAKFTN
jgi:hypothetical protein